MGCAVRQVRSSDDVRERLNALIGKSVDRECPTCSGGGRVTGPIRQVDIATAAGLDKMTLNTFVHGGTRLYFDNGLKLLAAIETLEAAVAAVEKPRVNSLPTDGARNPAVREGESERMRQIRNASAEAAAKAGIDAINRPLASTR